MKLRRFVQDLKLIKSILKIQKNFLLIFVFTYNMLQCLPKNNLCKIDKNHGDIFTFETYKVSYHLGNHNNLHN